MPTQTPEMSTTLTIFAENSQVLLNYHLAAECQLSLKGKYCKNNVK